MLESTRYEIHGSGFDSFVRPSDEHGGHSDQLCAWRLTVPAGLVGVPHRPDRDEVVLGVDGVLQLFVAGVAYELAAGGVALVRAGDEFAVDGGSTGGTAWVTTTPGLRATTRDGAVIEPPWAR